MDGMVTRIHNIAANIPPLSGETPVIPGPLISDHYRKAGRYHNFREKGSTTWLIFCTVGGNGYFRSVDGKVAIARAGDMMLYRPRIMQAYGTPRGKTWDFHWAHFVPRPAWTPWLDWPRIAPDWDLGHLQLPSPSATSRIAAEFSELHRFLRRGSPILTEHGFNVLEKILLLCAERLPAEWNNRLDARIQKVLDAIEAKPFEDHRLPALARDTGLSPSRLAHLFKRETGDSVIQRLIKVRLFEASKLLRLSNSPVSEVAHATGFNSPYYFSRRFRQEYGLSPTVFRAGNFGTKRR